MNVLIENREGSILKYRGRFVKIKGFFENGSTRITEATDNTGKRVELELNNAQMTISQSEFDCFMKANIDWQKAVHLQDGVMQIDSNQVPDSQYSFALNYNGTLVLEDWEYDSLYNSLLVHKVQSF